MRPKPHKKFFKGIARLAGPLLLALVHAPFAASADILTVPLSSTSRIETSTAIVNPASGFLEVPLQVDGWQDTGGLQTTPIDVGDGRDGSFNLSTYLSFDDGSGGGQVIHLNTDVHPNLQFTDFNLASGWTIRPTGSKPLIIRSLSTITIAGTIDCNGGEGAALNANVATSSAGGTARCGGSFGGRGGAVGAIATAGGAPIGNAPASGQAGAAQGDGGGGGGGFANTAPPASDGTSSAGATAGAGGAQGNDSAFSVGGGGAGGGGGAVDTTDVGFESSGGGGGAGGGSVYLYSGGNITVSAGALVSASGGAGGGGASRKGGAGGGGGGGSILLFAGGILQVDGNVFAQRGNGGANALAASGGSGGNGGAGRTWATSASGMPTGTGNIDPSSILANLGAIDSRVGSFTAVSGLLDFGATSVALRSIDADFVHGAAGNSLSLEIATADQPFSAASAAWAPSSDLARAGGHRYARLRLTLANQSASSPLKVRSVSITYSPVDQPKFDFSSCQIVKGAERGPGGGGPALLLLLLPMAICLGLRACQKIRRVLVAFKKAER